MHVAHLEGEGYIYPFYSLYFYGHLEFQSSVQLVAFSFYQLGQYHSPFLNSCWRLNFWVTRLYPTFSDGYYIATICIPISKSCRNFYEWMNRAASKPQKLVMFVLTEIREPLEPGPSRVAFDVLLLNSHFLHYVAQQETAAICTAWTVTCKCVCSNVLHKSSITVLFHRAIWKTLQERLSMSVFPCSFRSSEFCIFFN